MKGPLLRTVARTGFKRGLAGPGGRAWVVIGLSAGMIQWLRRKRDEPKFSISEKLEPGQSMLITHLRKEEAR